MYKPSKVEVFLPDGTLLFSSEEKPPAKKEYGYPFLVPVIADLKRLDVLKRVAKDDEYDSLADFLRAEKEMKDERE